MREQKNQLFEKREVSLVRVKGEAQRQKDVKNAESSDYVYENTFENDKLSLHRPDIFQTRIGRLRAN
ncbi:MAG: hypothetical protein WAO35_06230 [Terriglobia bacterium]